MELLHALPKPKNLVFVERLRFVKVMDKIDAGLRKSEIKASFQNRWFLPDWWRIAYEKAVQPNLLGMKQTSDCLLLPSLSPEEMGRFAFVVGGLQDQILHNCGKDVVLRPSEFFKSVVVGGQKSENQWRRLFSTVGGLRLQASGSVISLFQNENWGDDTAGGFVRFTLSFESEELLIGYIDPYREMLRRGRKHQSLCPFMGTPAPPTLLWKSLWADLSPRERRQFLVLASEQEGGEGLVGLDGECLSPMHRLFEEGGSGSSGRKKSRFLQKLRNLDSLTRKLTEHGYSTSSRVEESEFPPVLFSTPQGMALYWKPEIDSHIQSRVSYESRVSQLFLGRLLDSPSELEALLGGFVDKDRDFGSLAREISASYKSHMNQGLGHGLRISRNKIVPSFLLYLEWSVRLSCNDRGEKQLPHAISQSKLETPFPDNCRSVKYLLNIQRFFPSFVKTPSMVHFSKKERPS